MTELSKTFDEIIATLEGDLASSRTAAIEADEAYLAIQNTLMKTILPRRVTVRGKDGARLSIVAKNRRIIKLAEVHPEQHWTGANAPEKTECRADYDTFAHPLASALINVVSGEPIQIEHALVLDPLGPAKVGYPAATLCEHIEQSQQRLPARDQVVAFYEAQNSLPRGRFGQENEVTVPADASITHDWMQARIDEVVAELEGVDHALKIIAIGGDSPRALAVAWLDGEGALVLCDDAEKLEALRAGILSLRAHL